MTAEAVKATTGVRSFIAVPLPERVQAGIFAAAGELARALPSVKWSRKVENLHVTIKFLGKVAEERLGEVGAALARAVGGLGRFGLEVRGVGAFPSPRKASVIWIGVDDGAGRLAGIARAVEETAAALGVGEREPRPFRGHVTVGRAKGRDAVDARSALAPLADRSFGALEVGELHLYESVLGKGPDSDGSTYILRSRATLAGAAATGPGG